MSDDITGPADEPDADERVRELATLREEPSERFVSNVLDGINRRQATSQAIELSWWGLTGFFMEVVQSVCRALGLRDDDERS